MRKIHFIGIGGIGMSALAEIFFSKGDEISGSDIRANDLTEALSRKGVNIFQGHSPDNISGDIDLVVRSMSILKDNPELVKSEKIGLKIIFRSEMLRYLLEESGTSLTITGTHGKTTTSALISHIICKSGKDPAFLIGGEVESLGGNARCGKDDMVIAELDESDGFFRKVSSTYAVITNIEREHMEHYVTFEDLKKAYAEFISNVPSNGFIVYNGEDALLSDIVKVAGVASFDFGCDIEGKYKYYADIKSLDKSVDIDIIVNGKLIGTLRSTLIGRHNAMNILAAASMCMELGLSFDVIKSGVRSFKTVKRRFSRIGTVGGIEIIEDYAHHPTEIKAVIKAAKEYNSGGRVIAVFQPHRYSRTHDLADDFVGCFYEADMLVLTDIYSADEEENIITDIGDIYARMDLSRFEKIDLVQKEKVIGLLAPVLKEKDLVLLLGAGDLRDIGEPLLESLRKKIVYKKDGKFRENIA